MLHTLKNNLFMLSTVYRTHKAFLYVSLLVYVSAVITPLTGVLGLKLIFDALTGSWPFYSIAAIAVGYGLLNGGRGLLDAWYQNSYLPVARARIQGSMGTMLMQKTVELDLANFDEAEFYNKYTRAINEANTRAVEVVTTVCGMVGNALSITALTVMILAIEPFVLLCTLVGVVISLVFDILRSKLYYRYDVEVTPYNRRLAYIQRIFYEPQYSKELRLFQMGEPGMEKYRSNIRSLSEVLKRQGRKKFMLAGVERFVNDGLFVMVALLYLGWRCASGVIGLGSFSAMFNAAFQFGNELNSFVNKFPTLYQHSLFIDNLLAVLHSEGSAERGGDRELAVSSPHGIEFEDECFGYRGGPKILDHVSFRVGAGEKIAIVGYNGAGKSTLVKLMTRLYDPDEGRILVDGIDIREYSTASLRRAFGVMMQDFQHYAFSLAENVRPGFRAVDEQRVLDALEFSGLSERVGKLPKGIYSPVTKEFETGGVVMSGGEFQKLSLARAYAQGAQVLILDEPSGALDPVAEYELNHAILRASENKTVVFISHRLSATRMADRVYMVESGRIVESGTHAQLMEKDGRYARIFRMQAEKYVS